MDPQYQGDECPLEKATMEEMEAKKMGKGQQNGGKAAFSVAWRFVLTFINHA